MICIRTNSEAFLDALLADELQLPLHCSACEQAWLEWTEMFHNLSFLAPAITPPTRLKAQIMSRVLPKDEPAVQSWKNWNETTATRDFDLVRADAGWEETAIPGIRVRRLSVDKELDRISMLIRMEPRTMYPPHVHGGIEECFVLEGSLQVGDLTMYAGDFQKADTSSIHCHQSTQEGCLLLVNSSAKDILFP
ncbi:MAG: cupin domain-containing protein [Acidobacteria bacterium]|nr:cupin domain-containing protein [Acidobacteriota bacterium]MCB9399096.1 cupin domain-containing protein [Acidobacteriota bacterium]